MSKSQLTVRQGPFPPFLGEKTESHKTSERQKQDLKSGRPDSRAHVLSLLQTAFLAFRKEAGRQTGKKRQEE